MISIIAVNVVITELFIYFMFPPVNPPQHQIYVKSILKLSSPLTENTLRLQYKNQLVNFLGNYSLFILKAHYLWEYTAETVNVRTDGKCCNR
jgi:hypothetical protein